MGNGTGPTAANPTAPPAAGNPNSPSTAVGTTSSTNTLATFNDQMFLLDAFAKSGTSFGGVKLTNTQVPLQAPFSQINDMLRVSGEGMFNWLQDLKPKEYAQLIPNVSLYFVDANSEAQTLIPLTTPSKIKAGLEKSNYYTTNTVGLKSFDMSLDGNTNPVSGKIYNISMVLLFDSVNTFFEHIPSTDQTYADVFRTQGTTAGDNYKYKIKLCVSYSSNNQTLTQKYKLNDPSQVFSSYLTLIKTDLKLKENLQTEVAVEFQGFEEGMLKNQKLFDFLKVDVDAARRRNREALADALGTKETGLGEDSVAQTDYNNAMKEINEGIQGQVNSALNDHLQIEVSIGVEGEDTVVSGLSRQIKALNFVSAMRGAGIAISTEQAAQIQGTMGAHALTVAQRTQFIDYVKERTASSPNDSPAPAAGGTDPANPLAALDALYNDSTFAEVRNSADRAKTARDELAAAIKNVNDTYEGEKNRLEAQLQNIRMSQLREALDGMLFSKDVFYEIKVNGKAVQEYIDNLVAVTPKNYFSENSLNIAQATPIAQPPPPPRSEQPSNPNNSITTPEDSGDDQSGTASSSAKIDENAARMSEIDAEIQELTSSASRNEATSKAYADGILTPPGQEFIMSSKNQEIIDNYLDAQEAVGRITGNTFGSRDAEETARILGLIMEQEAKDARAKIEELAKEKETLAAATKAENENISSLGTITALEKDLNEFQTIRFVYLGDLLSCVMNRLMEDPKTSANGKAHLQKVRLLLTKIELPRLGTDTVDTFPLYKMPISVLQLQKLFADRLYGTQKSNFTLFELLQNIVKIVSLSQQRKAKLLHKSNVNTSYTLSFMPYPLDADMNLATDPNTSVGILHGTIIRVRDTSQSLVGLDGSYSSNRAKKIPHVFFGGHATGALKSIELAAINDPDLQKVAFSRLRGGNASNAKIPALFEVTLKLVGTPYFHLGVHFYLEAPTVNIQEGSGWFFLEGYYSVKNLNHAYDAGGQYTTTVVGHLVHDKHSATNAVTVLPADQAGPTLAPALPAGIPSPTNNNP